MLNIFRMDLDGDLGHALFAKGLHRISGRESFHVLKHIAFGFSICVREIHGQGGNIITPSVGDDEFHRVGVHASGFCHDGGVLVDTFVFIANIRKVNRWFAETVETRRITNRNTRKREVVADIVAVGSSTGFTFGNIEIFLIPDVDVNTHFGIPMTTLSCIVLCSAERDHRAVIRSVHGTLFVAVQRTEVDCHHGKAVFVPYL